MRKKKNKILESVKGFFKLTRWKIVIVVLLLIPLFVELLAPEITYDYLYEHDTAISGDVIVMEHSLLGKVVVEGPSLPLGYLISYITDDKDTSLGILLFLILPYYYSLSCFLVFVCTIVKKKFVFRSRLSANLVLLLILSFTTEAITDSNIAP